MQILGLLGMFFDAVVVEVEKSFLFSDWLWPYCEQQQNICSLHALKLEIVINELRRFKHSAPIFLILLNQLLSQLHS